MVARTGHTARSSAQPCRPCGRTLRECFAGAGLAVDRRIRTSGSCFALMGCALLVSVAERRGWIDERVGRTKGHAPRLWRLCSEVTRSVCSGTQLRGEVWVGRACLADLRRRAAGVQIIQAKARQGRDPRRRRTSCTIAQFGQPPRILEYLSWQLPWSTKPIVVRLVVA